MKSIPYRVPCAIHLPPSGLSGYTSLVSTIFLTAWCCPLARTSKLIVLYWLEEYQVMRYSEIKRALGNITHKMLSETLKEMESDDLIIRKEYPQVPPKVEYRLSEKGNSLIPIIDAMCKWGSSHK